MINEDSRTFITRQFVLSWFSPCDTFERANDIFHAHYVLNVALLSLRCPKHVFCTHAKEYLLSKVYF
jgi:hypothetical protein